MLKPFCSFLVTILISIFFLTSCSEEKPLAVTAPAEKKPEVKEEKVTPPEPPQKRKVLVKDKKGWKVIKVDSFNSDDKGWKAIDGNPKTMWHTEWKAKQPKHPHEIQVDLGKKIEMHGFSYLTRQYGALNGTIKEYEFYVSNDRKKWGEPIKKGIFEDIQYDRGLQVIYFDKPVEGRYIRLVSKSEVQGMPFACCAELNIVIEE